VYSHKVFQLKHIFCIIYSITLFSCSYNKELKQILENENPDYRITKAKEFYTSGKYKMAKDILDVEINAHHTLKSTFLLYADILFGLEDYEDAGSIFNQYAHYYTNPIEIEYALYMSGLSYSMEASKSENFQLLVMAQTKFKEYQKVYPNGKFNNDVNCKNKIISRILENSKSNSTIKKELQECV